MPTRGLIVAVAVVVVPACSAPLGQRVPETYVKASNTDSGDDFGRAIALSADGTTLAVGAPREDSPARGINQSQDNQVADTRVGSFGAVYVFVDDGTGWRQQAYIKASNSEVDDWFGASLGLSADGNTLAVGATGEDSGSATDQSSNSAQLAGAAYVFARSTASWSQVAYVKAPHPAEGDSFGSSVALSGDGSILAVGAPGAMAGTGAVHVFARSGALWGAGQSLPAPQVDASGEFGSALALSLDGSTLAVGAPSEDVATGNMLVAAAGAVHLFTNAGGAWSQPTRIVAARPGANDEFGSALSVSANGSLLAVSAPKESSAADGSTEDTGRPIGAVHVFSRTGTTWNPEPRLTLSSADAGERFGLAIALSSDGTHLAAAAPVESDAAKNTPPDSCAAGLGGTVYLFARTSATWASPRSAQASNTCKDDHFGQAIGLSRDGSILAVGANGEDSHAQGINQNENDNGAREAGAAYLLRY